MKPLVWILLIISFGTIIAVSGQETKQDKQVEQLKTRILVIEDYLKNRLDKLTQLVNQKQNLLKKLYESNLELRKELENMRQRMKVAESELLRVKIEIAATKKGQPNATTPEKKQPSVDAVEKRPSVQKYHDPKMQQLANALNSSETSIRIGAVVTLNTSENLEATPILIKALNDLDPYVVLLACKALAKRKASEAIESLVTLLNSDNERVRQFAHKALEKITDRQLPFVDNPQQNIAGWRKKLSEKKP